MTLELHLFKFFCANCVLMTYDNITTIDQLLAARQQGIESIIDCVHRQVEEYYLPNSSISGDLTNSKCKLQNETCDALVLGYLLRTFKALKIYPNATVLCSTISICELQALLGGKHGYPDFVAFKLPPPRCICNCCQEVSICEHCFNSRDESISTQVDHGKTCSPLPRFQQEIKEIVRKIEGLKYSRFASESENIMASHSTGKPVWDYLEYKQHIDQGAQVGWGRVENYYIASAPWYSDMCLFVQLWFIDRFSIKEIGSPAFLCLLSSYFPVHSSIPQGQKEPYFA